MKSNGTLFFVLMLIHINPFLKKNAHKGDKTRLVKCKDNNGCITSNTSKIIQAVADSDDVSLP